MADRTEQSNKIQKFNYYDSIECVCGKPKKHQRWLCSECMKKTSNTPERLDVDKKCYEHLDAVDKWLQKAKELNENS